MKFNIVFNYPQAINPRLVVTAGKVEIEGTRDVELTMPVASKVIELEQVLEQVLGIRVHINVVS